MDIVHKLLLFSKPRLVCVLGKIDFSVGDAMAQRQEVVEKILILMLQVSLHLALSQEI